jgi:hypothetical protein
MDRNRFPIPTPKPFPGNPTAYTSFRRSFKTLVESKGMTPDEMMYYLEQYLIGDACEAVAGCLRFETQVFLLLKPSLPVD